MKTSELIKRLQENLKVNGDCEVLIFDIQTLSSRKVEYIRYITELDFREDLKDDPSYTINFSQEVNNLVIL